MSKPFFQRGELENRFPVICQGSVGKSAIFLLVLLLVLMLPIPCRADVDDQAKEEQLRRLRGSIETLQETLNRTRGERDAAREELQPLERRIGAQVRQLRRFGKQITKAGGELIALRERARRERKKLARQTGELERQLRAAYTLGKQPYLKLLLNQRDPATVSRVLIYYRYVAQARAGRIQALQTRLAKLQTLGTRISDKTRTLGRIRDRQLQETRLLERSQGQRRQVLTRLNREVRSQAREISRLRRDERRLDGLLNQLHVYLSDSYSAPDLNARFADYKGRLPLPASGRITARFGSRKAIGDLKWNGIFLAGTEGQDVVAVFHGRVAFAGWLRGYGLLLILEHGDGYMTLYGHNQSLYNQVGDWVEAGQVIASMGNTGNSPRPGLYFEIRYKGKPRDPLRWAKR